MEQLGLFADAPQQPRPAKPDTALLLAMQPDYEFGGQARTPCRKSQPAVTVEDQPQYERPANWKPNDPHDQRHYVKTTAFQNDGKIMRTSYSQAMPVEITVRDIPMVISFGFGFSVHAVEKFGSLFISETGFRSFCGAAAMGEQLDHSDIDRIIEAIEHFIDAPERDGNGLAGKLVKWWPSYALEWRQQTEWHLTQDRATTWTQWGPEEHREAWESHDRRRRANREMMERVGINPNDLGPPKGFRGKWPDFNQKGLI